LIEPFGDQDREEREVNTTNHLFALFALYWVLPRLGTTLDVTFLIPIRIVTPTDSETFRAHLLLDSEADGETATVLGRVFYPHRDQCGNGISFEIVGHDSADGTELIIARSRDAFLKLIITRLIMELILGFFMEFMLEVYARFPF